MPNNTHELAKAREHLARSESDLASDDGLYNLNEGLALLDAIIGSEAGAETEAVAINLGQTYASRFFARIQQTVDENPGLPEPELERLFAVMRAFDDVCFELPFEARQLKIAVVRRLVDLYYEGFPAAEKEKIFAQLDALESDQRTR